jgi:chromosomal replication initiator protein
VHEQSEPHWRRFHEALRDPSIPKGLSAFVAGMRCVDSSPERLVVGFASDFALQLVNDYYLELLVATLARIAPDARLECVLAPPVDADDLLPVPAPADEPEAPPRAEAPISSNLPSRAVSARPAPAPSTRPRPATRPSLPSSPLNERYTFDTFVTGPSNQLAAAAARAVADNPGQSYNPLFIFGRVGLGKTHLAQAIGHHVLTRNPRARVQYQTTEQFVNDVVEGIRFERMGEVRQTYRECDLLIVDDIQFLANKETCQGEFFHTFNALHGSRRQVVVTSDKLPHEIPGIEDRIRSRFQWGLTVDLQPPEFETRLAIIHKKAATDRISLTEDVSTFLAQAVRSNVRELEGCLIRLGAYASLNGTPVTLELAQGVLRDIVQQRPVLTPEAVVKLVAARFDVKVADLRSSKRGRAIATPRQVAMYLIRKHINTSFPKIGETLGGKDHTTAINACRTIEERIGHEPELRGIVDDLERQLDR